MPRSRRVIWARPGLASAAWAVSAPSILRADRRCGGAIAKAIVEAYRGKFTRNMAANLGMDVRVTHSGHESMRAQGTLDVEIRALETTPLPP